MRKNIYICLFFITFGWLGAQNTFVKGYVITEKGDTLKGEIRLNPKKENEMYTKVYFKDANGVQKNFKPEKSKGFGYDNKHFVPMELDGEPMFFEVLVKGSLSLYKIMSEVMKMNEVFFEAEYFLTKEGDAKPIAVKESKFRKQMIDLMKDNAELAASYTEEKKFDLEKASELIKSYNTWKAGK